MEQVKAQGVVASPEAPGIEIGWQAKKRRIAIGRLIQLAVDALAILLITLVAALFLYHTVGWALDDSYITYRYAQNIELGYGAVFNVGEHYLGTTAPGFAILLALLHMVVRGLHLADLLSWLSGADHEHMVSLLDIPHLARYISALSVWTMGVAGYALFARSLNNWIGRAGGVLFAIWIASLPQISQVTGHETLTCIALILLGLYFVPRRRFLSGLLFGFSTLIRPDAALAFALAVAVMSIWWLAKRKKHQAYEIGRLLVGFLLPVVPWVLFAWWFYGSPIPGTLLAKRAQVSMGDWQIAYAELMRAQVLSAIPASISTVVTVSALFGLIVATVRRDIIALIGVWGLAYLYAYNFLKVTLWAWYVTPLFAVYLLMAVYGMAACVSLVWEARRLAGRQLGLRVAGSLAGTDSEDARSLDFHTRFTMPKFPLLFSQVVALPLAAIAGILLIQAITPGWRSLTGPKAIFTHTYSFIPVADYIRQQSPDGASVATPEPGALSYFLGPQYFVLDTLGLTAPGVSEHILAHDYEWPYLHYKPDWVLVSYEGNINPNLHKPWFEAEYKQVAEFHHPYWDAQHIVLRLFRRADYQVGKNLVGNGDFAAGQRDLIPDWGVPPMPVGSSVRIEPSDNGSGSLLMIGAQAGDSLNAIQGFKIEAGKEYLVQFEYRNRLQAGDQRVYCQMLDGAGNSIAIYPSGDGYRTTRSGDEWLQGEFAVTAPVNASKAVLWLRNRGIGEAWFRDIQVRQVLTAVQH